MIEDVQIGAFRHAGLVALPGLFAFGEIAWLREAAIALAVGHGATRDGRSFTPTTIRDVHLREPGFRKLAAHPRLLEPVRHLVGAEAGLLGTRLCLGAGFDSLANAAGEISAVVFLDVATAATRGGDRLGSALLVDGAAHYRDPRPSDGTVAFVASFGAIPAPADAGPTSAWLRLTAESDDCLWPNPFAALG